MVVLVGEAAEYYWSRLSRTHPTRFVKTECHDWRRQCVQYSRPQPMIDQVMSLFSSVAMVVRCKVSPFHT